MHPKFLEILCCPMTGSNLILQNHENFSNGFIKNGLLENSNGSFSYPIINGIPRFVDKEFYASSFGYEWKKWARIQYEVENIGRPMEGHTTKMFAKITELCFNSYI